MANTGAAREDNAPGGTSWILTAGPAASGIAFIIAEAGSAPTMVCKLNSISRIVSLAARESWSVAMTLGAVRPELAKHPGARHGY